MAEKSKMSPNESQTLSSISTGSADETFQTKSAKSLELSESEKSKRDTWNNHFEYIFACVGFAVGYGNIWRYPYLAYENGGAAFVIPYIISVLLCGLPLYAFETSLGQLSGFGVTRAHGCLAPVFQGVGWGMMFISYLLSLYYNMIVGWCLFYLGASVNATLPWARCNNTWNTEKCTSYLDTKECETVLNDNTTVYYNNTCINESRSEIVARDNTTIFMSASEEYFNLFVLNDVVESKTTLGDVSWRLVISLFSAWLLVFVCVAKGVKLSGKVIYFTASFPYFMLTILVIHASFLPGAGDGIYFYLVPNVTKLAEFEVWQKALGQVFFSLGPSLGGIVTMSSYNPFFTNFERDAIIVAVMDSLTSLFAGCAIFASLGYLANMTEKKVGDVVKGGLGLAFIVYPETLSLLPGSQFWSVLFFLMMITLGLGSQFVLFETPIAAIIDLFPNIRGKFRVAFVAGCAAMNFLIGILFCTGFPMIMVGILEAYLLVFVYGVNHYLDDIALILGKRLNWYWRITWLVTVPFYTLALLITSMYFYKPNPPVAYSYLSWCVSSVPTFAIVIVAVYNIVINCRAGKRWIELVLPSNQYNPKKRQLIAIKDKEKEAKQANGKNAK